MSGRFDEGEMGFSFEKRKRFLTGIVAVDYLLKRKPMGAILIEQRQTGPLSTQLRDRLPYLRPRIPVRENATVGPSEIEGHGLFATEMISRGTLILIHPLRSAGINHSCEPNLEQVELGRTAYDFGKGDWVESCGNVSGWVATRLIRKGEELTIRYSCGKPTHCNCPLCRKAVPL